MKCSVIIHQRLRRFIKIKSIVVSSIWSIRGKIKKSAGTFISPRLFIVQTSTLINSQTPWDIRYPKENKYPDPFPCKKCIAVGLHSFIYSIFFLTIVCFCLRDEVTVIAHKGYGDLQWRSNQMFYIGMILSERWSLYLFLFLNKTNWNMNDWRFIFYGYKKSSVLS